MKPTAICLAVIALAIGISGCSKGANLGQEATHHFGRYEEAIRRVIPDEARADRLAGMQAVVTQEMNNYYRNFSWAEDDARRANENYDITPDAFERIADGLTVDRKATMETVIRVSMRLRQEMTPEEWTRLTEEVR